VSRCPTAVLAGKAYLENEAKLAVAFMRNQKWKHPNAQKHGVFSKTAIVPGEDPREFEELYSGLVQEWEPAGATEEDAVLSIAKAVWRKRRVQKFLQVKLTKNFLDPRHPSYNESFGLLGFLLDFAAIMRTKPEVAFEEYASRWLRADIVKYLRQKFPRSDFKSTSEWARAIMDEIASMLLLASKIIEVPEAADMAALTLSAASLSDDLFRQELALDERLEAMIDRAVKRLIQTKAMKQMLGQTSTMRADDQPRTIVARGTSNR